MANAPLVTFREHDGSVVELRPHCPGYKPVLVIGDMGLPAWRRGLTQQGGGGGGGARGEADGAGYEPFEAKLARLLRGQVVLVRVGEHKTSALFYQNHEPLQASVPVGQGHVVNVRGLRWCESRKVIVDRDANAARNLGYQWAYLALHGRCADDFTRKKGARRGTRVLEASAAGTARQGRSARKRKRSRSNHDADADDDDDDGDNIQQRASTRVRNG